MVSKIGPWSFPGWEKLKADMETQLGFPYLGKPDPTVAEIPMGAPDLNCGPVALGPELRFQAVLHKLEQAHLSAFALTAEEMGAGMDQMTVAVAQAGVAAGHELVVELAVEQAAAKLGVALPSTKAVRKAVSQGKTAAQEELRSHWLQSVKIDALKAGLTLHEAARVAAAYEQPGWAFSSGFTGLRRLLGPAGPLWTDEEGEIKRLPFDALPLEVADAPGLFIPRGGGFMARHQGLAVARQEPEIHVAETHETIKIVTPPPDLATLKAEGRLLGSASVASDAWEQYELNGSVYNVVTFPPQSPHLGEVFSETPPPYKPPTLHKAASFSLSAEGKLTFLDLASLAVEPELETDVVLNSKKLQAGLYGSAAQYAAKVKTAEGDIYALGVSPFEFAAAGPHSKGFEVPPAFIYADPSSNYAEVPPDFIYAGPSSNGNTLRGDYDKARRAALARANADQEKILWEERERKFQHMVFRELTDAQFFLFRELGYFDLSLRSGATYRLVRRKRGPAYLIGPDEYPVARFWAKTEPSSEQTTSECLYHAVHLLLAEGEGRFLAAYVRTEPTEVPWSYGGFYERMHRESSGPASRMAALEI